MAIAEVSDKGRSVTLTYTTQGTYDPGDDTFTGQTTTTQTVKAVILNFRRAEIDGTLIKNGDRRALVAPDNLTRAPKTGDTITDGSEVFSIQNVEEVKPGDTVLLYKLQLRK